jgi:hypothetical protein
MNPAENVLTLWKIFTSVPCQTENKDALLVTASVSAVLWTGGIIAIQLDPNRARAKAVLGMEYLQFAFFAPAVALVAEPLVLRVLATASAMAMLTIGIKHIRAGGKAERLRRLAGPAADSTRIGLIAKNLLYYGRWTTACTIGAAVIAVQPTQTAVAWVALIVGFVGLQLVVRFLNVAEN